MFSTTKTMPILLIVAIWCVAFGLNFVLFHQASPITGSILFVFMLFVFGSAKFVVEDKSVVTKVLWARHVVPISEIGDMEVVEGFWRRQFGLAGVKFRRSGSKAFNIFSNAKDARGLATAIRSDGAYS